MLIIQIGNKDILPAVVIQIGDHSLARFAKTAVRSPPGPLVAGEGGDRLLAEGARRLRGSTDRAIIGLFGGNLLEIGQFLYRIDRFLMLLAGERPLLATGAFAGAGLRPLVDEVDWRGDAAD